MKNKGLGYGKLDTFCDLFKRKNLIYLETQFINTHKSTIEWSEW